MRELTENIQSLFYNPTTDSIAPLLHTAQEAHSLILEKTDFAKGTLAPSGIEKAEAIRKFTIPREGIASEDVPQLIADLFYGVSRWHAPRTMYNVAPPPVLPTVASKMFTSLYNPNLVLDTASGESNVTEQKVISAIAKYIGWDAETAGGSFTFGGKATTIYGVKIGLKKCSPDAAAKGVKDDVVVLSTNSGHPSHISDAGWTGIGTNNVARLKTDGEGRINLEDLEQAIISNVTEGKKIAAIIISGGSTNNMVVDPIAKVVELRDRLKQELNMEYAPHIHVDAVVGFPWIFFKDYNFEQNPLKIGEGALRRIARVVEDLRGLNTADSFGIDFHKMGFCPYVSSLFMVKDKEHFSGSNDPTTSPFTYTIENSRSGDGPNSAYVVLNTLGEVGFQSVLAHLTETAVDLQDKIEEDDQFEAVNKSGLGSSVMFVPRLPEDVTFENEADEIAIRNKYTLYFIEKLTALGNPYYLDKVPGDATGANPYPYIALKAYIMSPYSSEATNQEFVSYMQVLKQGIDKEFDFSADKDLSHNVEFEHPLK